MSKQWAVDRPGMRRTAGIQKCDKSHDATLIEEARRITDVMPRCALQERACNEKGRHLLAEDFHALSDCRSTLRMMSESPK